MKKGKDFTGVAVVFACHDGRGNLLFAKRGTNARDGHGHWELPAGGVKLGERIEEALLRELKEEFCVEPLNLKYITHKDVIQKEGDEIVKHWVTFDYLVQVDPEQVQIGEPEVCEEIRWCSIDDIPEPLHYGVKETLMIITPHL